MIFSKFFEPYASKGARTVPKGYNFVLIERLYKDKIVFLCEEIDMFFGGQMIALLLYLGSDNDDISLYINSPGGGAYITLGIYDTMKHVGPDVCTLAMGLAASAASLILVGGTITKRVAFPHARILIHQPSMERFKADIKTIQAEAEQMFILRDEIANIYAQNTGRSVNEIQKDLERDTFMSATEAKDYGIVDRVVKFKKEKEENKRRS